MFPRVPRCCPNGPCHRRKIRGLAGGHERGGHETRFLCDHELAPRGIPLSDIPVEHAVKAKLVATLCHTPFLTLDEARERDIEGTPQNQISVGLEGHNVRRKTPTGRILSLECHVGHHSFHLWRLAYRGCRKRTCTSIHAEFDGRLVCFAGTHDGEINISSYRQPKLQRRNSGLHKKREAGIIAFCGGEISFTAILPDCFEFQRLVFLVCLL
mmetsp:Transcript_44804/g.91468  ORF Transcript_44804/g.91468 Transcript_44804/m.91468 type:complete len:212 (-) Transcript_44804:1002-1637(-)